MANATIQDLQVSKIFADPDQPRKQFDPDALIRLAESMITSGQRVPISVTRDGKRFKIIDGERRFQAAQRGGIKTLQAIVELEVKDRFEAQIVSNYCREPHTIPEACAAVDRLMVDGRTQMEIGRLFGRSQGWVSTCKKLWDKLRPEVMEMISANKRSENPLALSVAVMIADMPRNKQLTMANRVKKMTAEKGRAYLAKSPHLKRRARTPQPAEIKNSITVSADIIWARVSVLMGMSRNTFNQAIGSMRKSERNIVIDTLLGAAKDLAALAATAKKVK